MDQFGSVDTEAALCLKYSSEQINVFSWIHCFNMATQLTHLETRSDGKRPGITFEPERGMLRRDVLLWQGKFPTCNFNPPALSRIERGTRCAARISIRLTAFRNRIEHVDLYNHYEGTQ